MAKRARFTAQHAANSVIGRISHAGMIAGSRGIPESNMRILGSYAAVYTHDGTGFYADANGLKRNISSGDLIIVFPDIPHSYGPAEGKTWNEFFLVFQGPVFDLWREAGLLDPSSPIIHLEPVHHWLRRFESVLGGQREAGWAPPLLEVCRLQQVLGEALMGGTRGSVRQEDVRWASRACVLIEEQLAPSLRIEDVAQRMNTSYGSFRKRFTRIVGMPPSRYRTTRLIDRACELIQQSDMTNDQIAITLGFCDAFHFSHRFKQVTGFSPRQYRRALPTA